MHYKCKGRTVVEHRKDLFKKKGNMNYKGITIYFVSYFTAKEKATLKLAAQDAIERLNSLQTSFEILEENRRTGRRKNKNGVEEMRRWLEKIDYSVADLDRLKVIHVAGTKGKGGTCAFVDSILREYRITTGSPSRVGLYTSPHIKHVRERIKINSEPISEESFARSFFKIWDIIAPEGVLDDDNRPGYFRFLTLMSFDIFLEKEVNVAIYETGIGGENDATNVIQNPIGTGITSLGIDHEKSLKIASHMRPSYFSLEVRDGEGEGATIEEIAWHKSGIFKAGCPAFAVHQQPIAENILRHRAQEKDVSLAFVDIKPEISDIKFPASIYRNNASLAVALANRVLDRETLQRNSNVTEEMIHGLKNARLPGRCQVLKDGLSEWYVDGAHTKDSLAVAGQWFAEATKRRANPIFIDLT
ncbi:MAG: hypothetical protein Q9217_004703 [Psora testacea]